MREKNLFLFETFYEFICFKKSNVDRNGDDTANDRKKC